MNNSFLEYVAQDIINKFGHDLSKVAVIFPNKRASLFLDDYLVRHANRTMWCPKYFTISELFRQYSNKTVADSIKLICELYKSFVQCTGSKDTLDKFYGWGQLLISDFDDIDKNMAPAEKVFANVQNIHEYDNLTYLTSEQKEVLKMFFSNFNDEQDSKLKQRFIELWSNLYNIYKDFNNRLHEQQLAYEGILYREVVDSDNIPLEYDTYIFVGFNLLQQVEQRLFKHIKQAGKALFYWDFDAYYMNNNQHEAGHYIGKYLEDFPNEFDNQDNHLYQNLSKSKDITFLSGKTENVQARYIAQWLSDKKRIEAGRKTAIVLCNEALLPDVIHCIPREAGTINITTGFPLSQSPISSLVLSLIQLQTYRQTHHSGQDRLTVVQRILRHPYVHYIASEHDSLLEKLNKNKIFYPSKADLCINDDFTLLFQDVSETDFNAELTQWLLMLLEKVGMHGAQQEDAFFHESIFRMYTILNRFAKLIKDKDLEISIVTYERIVAQIIKSTSIPFHGEPAEGIQIMGVLETRNLDFDHLLVLSCNEGNMPKGVNDASFIPHAIRQAYGLTTINHKISIYSYYFHRMIQRATDITLTYNNSTEGSQTGEMSQFMLQLLVERAGKIVQKNLITGQQVLTFAEKPIEKNKEVMQKLNAITKLSPSAINTYLRCPLLFYYKMIAKLREPDINDINDMRIFGNIFHRAAQLIYTPLIGKNHQYVAQYFDEFLSEKDNSMIKAFVNQSFNEIVFNKKNNQKAPQYRGMQLIKSGVINTYLKRLLSLDKRTKHLEIRDLEKDYYTSISFEVSNTATKTIEIGGIIDRLDYIHQEGEQPTIRIVDYKTGSPKDSAINDIEEIFNPLNVTKKHSDYYFQTFLYAHVIKEKIKEQNKDICVSPSLLFIQKTGGSEYDPVLKIGKEKVSDIATYQESFLSKLQSLLGEIYNKDIPFTYSEDTERCAYCPYCVLCGRKIDPKY